LQKALEFEYVQGSDEEGRLQSIYFIDFNKHGDLLKEIRVVDYYHYALIAPTPRWTVPSHFTQCGIS
jgi:hypothetical protein